MRPDPRRPIRCAIYTRKSTEYGLDQEFNSLDAQREAAEAFVKSQAHEGWRTLPDRYDDGGLSGGSLDRPAMQQLLAAVRAGRIDVVVVYKVDRLTRSLMDFAKLVELFDEHEVSFVSVTQQFNTTNSMGRLTLNVLLSFAQFEREVTGERIRDKIAASKRKGMRMGGPVPLGYDVKDKKLVVNEEEAERVRLIFSRYLELKSLNVLCHDLEERGIVTKVSARYDGSTRGGIPFTKGPLAYLLRNRVYIGEVIHKDRYYPGEHPPIVDAALFDTVQEQLAAQARSQKRVRAGSSALLIGRIFDDRGNRMSPANAHKNGARYRYYVSSAIALGREHEAGLVRRVPAFEIEARVLEAIRIELNGQRLAPETEHPDQFDPATLIDSHVERVVVRSEELEIALNCPGSDPNGAGYLDAHEERSLGFGARTAASTIRVPWTAATRMRREIVMPHGSKAAQLRPMRSDTRETLLIAIARARAWTSELGSGSQTAEGIAQREQRSERYIRMVLPLAFLPPRIVSAAINGVLPEGYGIAQLSDDPHLSWRNQQARLGVIDEDQQLLRVS